MGMQAIDKWHKSKTGLVVFGLIELGLAYVFVSWAIDSGRLLAWFLGVVFLIGVLQNLGRLVGKVLGHARA